MKSPGTDWVLQAEGIFKRFGDNEVLKGVSVQARQGDVISMIGSSGSGKSTFLRCLNLLEQPSAGRISVSGEKLVLVPDKAGALKAADAAQLQRLRSRVSMVFQHFNLWAHMTALENVIEAPIQVLGLSRDEAVARAERYLQRVGVMHRARAYPAHLSGGEQQRVAIARAVIGRPEVLVADEPTGNVDPDMARRLLQLFAALNRLGTTVVVATHDIHLLQEIENAQMMRLDKGRLSDPTGSLKHPPRPLVLKN